MSWERDAWDERYASAELIWGAEPNRFLVPEVEQLAPGRALDVACGEGRNAIWLAQRGWHVTAVDFSAAGLAKADTIAASRGVNLELVEADVREWDPTPAAFDLVIVLYLQLPAESLRRVFRRLVPSLAPGGTVLVIGHDSTNIAAGYGGPQDPAVLFGPDDIASTLGQLTIERAERVRRPVVTDEGEFVAIDALVRASRPAETD